MTATNDALQNTCLTPCYVRFFRSSESTAHYFPTHLLNDYFLLSACPLLSTHFIAVSCYERMRLTTSAYGMFTPHIPVCLHHTFQYVYTMHSNRLARAPPQCLNTYFVYVMSSITYRHILFKATDCIHGLASFLISVSHANLGLNKARSSSVVSLVYALVVTLRWPFCGCSMVGMHLSYLSSSLLSLLPELLLCSACFSSHSLASPLCSVQVG